MRLNPRGIPQSVTCSCLDDELQMICTGGVRFVWRYRLVCQVTHMSPHQKSGSSPFLVNDYLLAFFSAHHCQPECPSLSSTLAICWLRGIINPRRVHLCQPHRMFEWSSGFHTIVPSSLWTIPQECVSNSQPRVS